ncbi:Ribonuclease III [Lachnospiraceae bacterium TWA4]|nr:Ribonuclease III [Lachnospiraceae bacterium TWA4]
MENNKKFSELEDKIGYHFKNKELLRQALLHSSYTNEHRMNRLQNNERLEFLGDAVLELVSSDFFYHQYPEYPEGKLTRLRASMVCEPTLAFCTKEIELGKYLLLGKGEDATGGRNRDSITSDAMEAVIGAIYLDGGFANAKEFICRFILDDVENKQLFFDSKTILQEIVQSKFKQDLVYELLAEEGPDHDKRFTTRVLIGKKEVGCGTGKTKKASEQKAAYKAILLMKEQGDY